MAYVAFNVRQQTEMCVFWNRFDQCQFGITATCLFSFQFYIMRSTPKLRWLCHFLSIWSYWTGSILRMHCIVLYFRKLKYRFMFKNKESQHFVYYHCRKANANISYHIPSIENVSNLPHLLIVCAFELTSLPSPRSREALLSIAFSKLIDFPHSLCEKLIWIRTRLVDCLLIGTKLKVFCDIKKKDEKERGGFEDTLWVFSGGMQENPNSWEMQNSHFSAVLVFSSIEPTY